MCGPCAYSEASVPQIAAIEGAISTSPGPGSPGAATASMRMSPARWKTARSMSELGAHPHAAVDDVGAAHVLATGDEQLLGGEAGEDPVAGLGHQDLLLDPRGGDAVGGRAVGLQGEDHAGNDRLRVVEAVQAGDHRRLVEADAKAVAELQAEARFLVGEALLLGGRPARGDLVGGDAGADQVDRVVEPLAALLVGVDLGLVGAADRERAVVARAVAHEGVDDVEESLVAGA